MANYRRADGLVRIPFSCAFEFVDREGVARIAKGRTFVLEGQELDLFPVGALCGVLGRSHKAIYKWERDFGFPPALYRVSDVEQGKMRMRCNRWYSRKQLAAIRAIYQTFGCLRKQNRTKLRQFIAAVRKIFFQIDIPISNRKRNESERIGQEVQCG